jgi:hypothetical protein
MNSTPIPARRWSLRTPSLALVALVTVAGCIGETPSEPDRTRPIEEIEFNPSLGVNIAEMTLRPSGLYVKDEVEGTGAFADEGDEVFYDIELWLPDGFLVDETHPRGGARLVIGQGNALPSVTEGLIGMREGGRRLLVVPPRLAYGADGIVGVIGPFEWVVIRLFLHVVEGKEPPQNRIVGG